MDVDQASPHQCRIVSHLSSTQVQELQDQLPEYKWQSFQPAWEVRCAWTYTRLRRGTAITEHVSKVHPGLVEGVGVLSRQAEYKSWCICTCNIVQLHIDLPINVCVIFVGKMLNTLRWPGFWRHPIIKQSSFNLTK